jgi:hypothetical protein
MRTPTMHTLTTEVDGMEVSEMEERRRKPGGSEKREAQKQWQAQEISERHVACKPSIALLLLFFLLLLLLVAFILCLSASSHCYYNGVYWPLSLSVCSL